MAFYATLSSHLESTKVIIILLLQGDDDESSQSQEVPLVEQFTGVGIKVRLLCQCTINVRALSQRKLAGVSD